MLEKSLILLSIATIVFNLGACTTDNSSTLTHPYESSPKITVYEFENLAEEYDVEDTEMELYFYEDGVPYVDIDTFIGALEGAIVTDEIKTLLNDGVYTMTYTLEANEGKEGIYEDTELTLELDLSNNIVTVNRLAFFDAMSEKTKTDFGEFLQITDYEETLEDPVTIDFNDYDITTVERDGAVLLPFHIANLFFSGGMYDAYYNGEKIYGFDTYQLMGTNSINQTLNDSIKNSDSIPTPLKNFNTSYLALTFDYFYGLKAINGVDDYLDELTDYGPAFQGSDSRHYKAISDFLYEQDDIHTRPLINGFYENLLSFRYTIDDLEHRTRTYYEAYYNETLNTHCDSGNGVTTNDEKTKAIIKIDGFTKESLKEFNGFIDELDTVGTYEDIVIDLSCNGGGVIGPMIEMIGYMTDDPIPFYSRNITDNATSVTTFETDINARDYNFHILASPLSYSAANSLMSVAKENNLASIIGLKSSGGASSVMTNITPSGSIFFMSSSDIMTNSNYESIEYGIEADIPLPLESIPDSQAVFKALS